MRKLAEEVRDLVHEVAGRVVALRREFHSHPELGFQEHETSARVSATLSELGVEHRNGVARTGVLGTIRGVAPGGAALLLRADMDCLPIREENEVPYRSLRDGLMHACGHDGHTAILLGVAHVLTRLRDRFRGSVRLAFQPAEEGLGGAEPLIAEGALSDPDCEAAFALHLWNSLPTGTIGLREGAAMAAVDEFRIKVAGRGGHGAEPMATADPIVAAAQIVTALQTIVSRNLDATDSGVVTVAAIHGGKAYNVIPESVDLLGTLRSFRPETRLLLRQRVREIAESVARGMGCRAEVEMIEGYPSTINDPTMTRFARKVAEDVAGSGKVVDSRPVMGSEDFSYFLRKVPGAFVFLGSNNPEKGFVHPHHSPRFDFDESSLTVGVEFLSMLALRFLEERPARR